jgi:hypothetical protein
MQGLATHPQLPAIIDAALQGQPVRQIAAWTDPKVSFSAIADYIRRVVRPTLTNARELVSSLPSQLAEKTRLVGTPDQKPSDAQPAQLTKQAILGVPILAAREKRLAELQDRHNRMKLIVDERAVEMKDEIAGGASGLLCRDYKGKDAKTAVYKVDTGLLAEFREHEKQLAQELGQWQEGSAPTVAIQIVMPSMQGPSGPAEVEPPTIDIGLPKR